MKIQFIEDLRGSLKLLSVHATAIWAAIIGIIAADPMLFVTAWNAIPSELREYMPPWVRWLVAFSALFGTVYLARVVKQPVTKKGRINEVVRQIEETTDAETITPEQKREIAERFIAQDDAAKAKAGI